MARLIMAETLRRLPAIVLTSDPHDMTLLAGVRTDITIVAV